MPAGRLSGRDECRPRAALLILNRVQILFHMSEANTSHVARQLQYPGICIRRRCLVLSDKLGGSGSCLPPPFLISCPNRLSDLPLLESPVSPVPKKKEVTVSWKVVSGGNTPLLE